VPFLDSDVAAGAECFNYVIANPGPENVFERAIGENNRLPHTSRRHYCMGHKVFSKDALPPSGGMWCQSLGVSTEAIWPSIKRLMLSSRAIFWTQSSSYKTVA
jgi:hypothetical protein